MSITIQCPQCGKRYTVDEAAAGKVATCAGCGVKMRIPETPRPAEPAPEPAPGPALGPAQPPAPEPEPTPAAGLPTGMRANRAVAGRTCPICQKPVELGQAVRNCELCGHTHHDECWQKHNGCGTADCANAPLPDLGFAAGEAQPPSAAAAPPGTKPCPHCGEHIPEAAIKCRHCLEYLAGHGPAGPGRAPGAPPTTNGLAVASLVVGLVSLPMMLCCGGFGGLLGILAIVLGAVACSQISKGAGRIGGKGLAVAGIILGVSAFFIGIVFFVFMLIFQLGSQGSGM